MIGKSFWDWSIDEEDAYANELGYPSFIHYLGAFRTPEGRADMADRFVRKARQLGLDITVYYE